MNMLKKIFILILILLIPHSIVATEFVMGSSTSSIDTCSSDTSLIIVTTTNTNSASDTYTLSLSGEASKWAVVAPQGFVLQPDESQNSYIYITVPSGTLTGKYELKALVSSNSGGQQTQIYSINVDECNSVSIEPVIGSQSICTCTEGSFEVKVYNTGRWTENYRLSLSGSGASWTTLSEDMIGLQSGESKTVSLTAKPVCGDAGDFEVTVTTESLNSNALASTTLDIKVDGCYDFDFVPAENYLSFCDNSEAKVPINIQNKGTVGNSYVISIDGPSWASFDKKRIVTSAGKVESNNLVLSPGFGVTGNFPMTITVEAEQGDIVKTDTFTANVLSCRQTSLDIAQNYDFVCGGSSKSYSINLLNAGKFKEGYSVSVTGPVWARLSNSFVSLEAGEFTELDLELAPAVSVPAGKYKFVVEAKSQNVGRTFDSDYIEVSVPERSNCFGVQLEVESNSVEVVHGEGELVPVVINNIGTTAAKYELEISGSGANLAQLNPGVVELEGNSAGTVYLHLSAPDDTAIGTHGVIISARNSEDNTVSGSVQVSLNVVESRIAVLSDITPEIIKDGNTTVSRIFSTSIQSVSSALSYVTSAGGTVWTYSKGKLIDYWHIVLIIVGMVLFILVVWRYGVFKRSEDDWFEELEELFDEDELKEEETKKPEPKKIEPKKPEPREKTKGIWRKFVDWLTEEDEFDDFEFEYEEPKKKKDEDKIGLIGKFKAWLEEDEGTKPAKKIKEKPKKEEPKKPKKEGSGLWKSITDWMYEDVEEEPKKETVAKKKPKKPAKAKPKKGKSAWQKFKNWLEEED